MSKAAPLSPVALLIYFFAAAPLHSEVHECNGVWRDLPCDQVQSSMPYGQRAPQQPEDDKTRREQRQARFLFNELDLKRLEMAKLWNVEIDINPARQSCLGSAAQLEPCKTVLAQLNQQLEERVQKERQVRATEGENQTPNREEGKNSVVIINNNPDRWWWDEDGHPIRPIPPIAPIPPPAKPENKLPPMRETGRGGSGISQGLNIPRK